jgi:Protein similar to CwfJ C-terminus 2
LHVPFHPCIDLLLSAGVPFAHHWISISFTLNPSYLSISSCSYFHVEFALSGGYAHVIENEARFPEHFGPEIVAGMLQLGPEVWLRPKRIGFEKERIQVLEFLKQWKAFDWTSQLDGGAYD